MPQRPDSERSLSEPVEDFATQYAREAAPGLDRIELIIGVVGGVTTALTVLALDLSLTVGWGSGWLVGQANVALLRRLMVRVIGGGLGSKVGLFALVLKMLVLMGLVWWVLSALPVSPIGFVGGFTMTIAGLVVGSVIVATRDRRQEPGSVAAEVDAEPIGGESSGATEGEGSDHVMQTAWSPV